MNAIGKIQRSRALRQVDDLPLRREYENVLAEEILHDAVDKFLAVLGGILGFNDLAQPAGFAIQQALYGPAFLIHPVRGNAVFRRAVHLLGTNLHFKRNSVRREQRCMERTVHVWFWRCDIVLKPTRDWLPVCVNHAERGITVVDGIYDDANRNEIVNLVDARTLALHLAVYAVKVLWAAADAAFDTGLVELFANDALCVFQRFRTLRLFFAELLADVRVLLRQQIHEREVFHFALDGAHAETVRQRSVHFERFLCFSNALVGVAICERTHVVQPVRELDDDHANVRRNG